MSRPLSFVLPVACAVISLSFTACVGTLYDRMYSNKKSHYRPPPAKKEVSAEDVLKSLESKKKAGEVPADAGLPMVPGDIPGLPGGMPTEAPPAIPGLPPVPPP